MAAFPDFGSMAALDWLNAAPHTEAVAALFRCCGCAGWAGAVASARPFPSPEALVAVSEVIWAKASNEDVLEALSHHPRLGDRETLRARFLASHDWSADEHSAVSAADGATLEDLAQANQDYETRFGHIFVACTTGKTAADLLALLRERLGNAPGPELKIAALEQMKITRLRLAKVLREHGGE